MVGGVPLGTPSFFVRAASLILKARQLRYSRNASRKAIAHTKNRT